MILNSAAHQLGNMGDLMSLSEPRFPSVESEDMSEVMGWVFPDAQQVQADGGWMVMMVRKVTMMPLMVETGAPCKDRAPGLWNSTEL